MTISVKKGSYFLFMYHILPFLEWAFFKDLFHLYKEQLPHKCNFYSLLLRSKPNKFQLEWGYQRKIPYRLQNLQLLSMFETLWCPWTRKVLKQVFIQFQVYACGWGLKPQRKFPRASSIYKPKYMGWNSFVWSILKFAQNHHIWDRLAGIATMPPPPHTHSKNLERWKVKILVVRGKPQEKERYELWMPPKSNLF